MVAGKKEEVVEWSNCQPVVIDDERMNEWSAEKKEEVLKFWSFEVWECSMGQRLWSLDLDTYFTKTSKYFIPTIVYSIYQIRTVLSKTLHGNTRSPQQHNNRPNPPTPSHRTSVSFCPSKRLTRATSIGVTEVNLEEQCMCSRGVAVGFVALFE